MNKLPPIRKSDIAFGLSFLAECNRDYADRVVRLVFETMAESLKRGHPVVIKSFGRFDVRERKARTFRNPRNGETIEVPARQVVVFRPSPCLLGTKDDKEAKS
ncbi:MAG TPA: HU family DNA-binding protein [Planctomycetes bacterium]|nr:HU family DNA-binding protein [Planctomycetota bacterium]